MSEIFGLSKYGFKAKKLKHIKDELETELRKTVDTNLRFTPDTVAGQITAIVANQIAQVWEMAAGLFASLDANMAHGQALDSLCALTGTYRRRAEHSRVKVLVRLAGGAQLPKDSIAALANDANARFKTVAGIKNDSSKEAVIEAEMLADEVGPIYAKAASKWMQLTPQADWLGITNTTDAILGRLDETDEELRLRRVEELRAVGSATHDAIRVHLKALDGVQAVHIEEGEHSFTAYVMGGDEKEICRALWKHKPLGVSVSGDITHAVLASNGQEYRISFSRPKIIELSLHIKLRVVSALNAEELTALKAKIHQYILNHIKLGDEPYPLRLYPIFLNEPKILDIISIGLQRVGSTESAPTIIKPQELVRFDINQIFIG